MEDEWRNRTQEENYNDTIAKRKSKKQHQRQQKDIKTEITYKRWERVYLLIL